MYTVKTKNAELELRAVEKGIFRVRVSHDGEYTESLMSRYNILRESGEAADASFEPDDPAVERGVELHLAADRREQSAGIDLLGRFLGKRGARFVAPDGTGEALREEVGAGHADSPDTPPDGGDAPPVVIRNS